MEDSAAASLVAAEDGPESWEVADVEASVRRLLLSSKKDSDVSFLDETTKGSGSCCGSELDLKSGLGSGTGDDVISSVDQFLREAIQNPRERLSVLRMEQEVERFIHDPTREQMEFQQLPTSYLRLAAHRVAQHYSLQSMVLLDNNLPDGSGSRIIVRKTSNIQLPLIRLADIPVNLPTEESGAVKVAIKQRPQKGSLVSNKNNNLSAHSAKSNSSKSVEERKEEYNKARARIFNANNSSGSSSVKPVNSPRNQDSHQHGSSQTTKIEDGISAGGGSEATIGISFSDSSTSSSRLPKNRMENEPIGRPKPNNRVAIFRDREVDCKDPDYDRSYDRYMQRFDPGFGFIGGQYAIQPMYVPAVNYNTEFPQLGSSHRPPISSEPQPHLLHQHFPGPWMSPSSPAGISYGPADVMLSPFTSSHVNACSNGGLYLHSAPYPCQRSGLPYMHPLEQIHQPFSQSHQQQPDMGFGLARPR
ncbi:uncharacterized protein LOC127259642 [Andrographis paniculata]|uniref:uncharacterized protein LOC127259642 n=1 Tax=Andrographis paniculata TaxID=175694 RepID=UPI0021E6D890|nr:uncharacterized protein LOC127259642 [Andrographis paniculata]